MSRLQSLRHPWRICGSGIIVTALGFLLAYQFIQPAPPDHIRIATGEKGGAYHRFAEKYAAFLARERITLELVNTSGSVENLSLVRRGEVDLAIVQGGTGVGTVTNVEGLGGLFFEPLWLFHRDGLELDRITGLRGLRVAIGPDGSGTQALVWRLLTENRIDTEGAEILTWDTADAAGALKAGSIDAAFTVASPESPVVKSLLTSPGIRACSFDRSSAYARRHLFLHELVLPEGAIDLVSNIPGEDLQLVAPAATLVARPDLHPAIASLILQAAQDAHGGGGLFENPGQFPTPNFLEFPVNAHATSFYQHGPPFLQRYLPFWAASLVDRFKIMLLPLLVLLIPMFKVMPFLYRWRMQAKVYRWYQELATVDIRFEDARDEAPALIEELDDLEHEVQRINVPLAYAGQAYILRQHIDMIRTKIKKSIGEPSGPPDG